MTNETEKNQDKDKLTEQVINYNDLPPEEKEMIDSIAKRQGFENFNDFIKSSKK